LMGRIRNSSLAGACAPKGQVLTAQTDDEKINKKRRVYAAKASGTMKIHVNTGNSKSR
jgi:hypothetical protein